MQHFRNKEKWILYAAAVLLCMTLVSFWMTSSIYARYSTQVSGSDSARVAKFSVDEVQAGNSSDLTKSFELAIAPGEKQEYRVQVTNNSEVAIEYVITAANKYGNLPLDFTIKDVTGSSGSTDTGGSEGTDTQADSAAGSGASVQSGQAIGTIGANDNSAHTYSLTVSWPSDKNSPDYAGKVDMLVVGLEARQVD